MGPGSGATSTDNKNAYAIGELIAKNGWILLSGGRDSGVMDSVNKGAKNADGLTIGILPTSDHTAISEAVDIPILTGLQSARNNINVLSSDVVVACGIGAGTVSEIALALKADKNVILLNDDEDSKVFLKKIGKDSIHVAENPEKVIELVKKIIK